MLDKPWTQGVQPRQKTCYQPLRYCTYWPVLSSFNNWNIITFHTKDTTSEVFEEIHQIFFDGISENMSLLVQPGNYGATNTTDY